VLIFNFTDGGKVGMGGITKKVFLVEDDKKLCEEFEKAFRAREDYALAGITDNAGKAFEQIVNDPPDVVLIDLRLDKDKEGDYSGIELVDMMQERFLIPPCIIIISVVQEEQVIESLYRRGVDYRFDKNEKKFGAKLVLEHMEDIYPDLKKPVLKNQ